MSKRRKSVKPSYYWDATVFLDLINATKTRLNIIEALLEDCENGKVAIFTSVLSIVEVAYVKADGQKPSRMSADQETRIDKLWQPPSPIQLVEAHQRIIFDARELVRSAVSRSLKDPWVLKPPDAIHLATAKHLKVNECHSYDSKWPRFAQSVGCKICEPHTAQGQLF